MKIKRMISAMLCAVLVGLLAVPAYADVGTTNHFSTGVVDIELQEFELLNGREVAYGMGRARSKTDAEGWQVTDSGTRIVTPGETVSLIPKITNLGVECYIRVKVVPTTKKDGKDIDIRDGIGGVDLTKWVKKDTDGYYYLKNSLKQYDTAELFREITIPTTFDNTMKGYNFGIKILVEAIQTENVTPNYESAAPWGNVEIKECQLEAPYTFREVTASDREMIRITYDDVVSGLVKNKDDAFSAFNVLMPGCSYDGVLELENTHDRPYTIMFSSAVPSGAGDLYKNIKLKIKLETPDHSLRDIYDGTMADSALNKFALVHLEPGEKGRLLYNVSVDPSVNNDDVFAYMQGYIQWLFSIQMDEIPTISLTIPVKKTSTGDALPNGETFTFKIEAMTQGAPMPLNNLAVLSGVGTVSFGEITYTKAGVYQYRVTEVQGTTAGMVYDNRAYTVTVTVTEKGEEANKRLTVEMSCAVGNTPSDVIHFNNSYTKPVYIDPKTGDTMNSETWMYCGIGLGVIAVVGGLLLVFNNKKKKEEE